MRIEIVASLICLAILLPACAPVGSSLRQSPDILPSTNLSEGEIASGLDVPDDSLWFIHPLFRWYGFYCLTPDCNPELGYNQSGPIHKGGQVGCPYWVEAVTSSHYDLLLKRNVATTAFVYLLPRTCIVNPVK